MTRAAAKKAAAPPDSASEAVEEQVEHATVFEAWTAVMREVLSLGKNHRVTEGGNFLYRGIDDLMNLVGPVLRKHGVTIIPTVESTSYRDVQTSKGKPSREVTVRVTYTIYGPQGDSMVGRSAGESMDFGDKGTAKAMSVAYRVFLLQSLTLPTDEPDPDSTVYERSSGPTLEQRAQMVAEGLPRAQSAKHVQHVKNASTELLDLQVTDPEGNSLPLGVLLDRKMRELDPAIGQERSAAANRALGGGEDVGGDLEAMRDHPDAIAGHPSEHGSH